MKLALLLGTTEALFDHGLNNLVAAEQEDRHRSVPDRSVSSVAGKCRGCEEIAELELSLNRSTKLINLGAANGASPPLALESGSHRRQTDL